MYDWAMLIRAPAVPSLLLFALLCLSGCEEEQTSTPADSAPPPDSAPPDLVLAPDAAGDLPLPDAALDALAVADLAPGETGAADASAADAGNPWGKYVQARGLIHMHSIYSHDACDGKGFTAGKPNLTCLKQLRAALCKSGFDFTFLTDHPSNMKSYSLKEDMLHDASAGDKLWLYKGAPIANLMACPGGHQVMVSVGYEALHMMPLGLHELPTSSAHYGGISDSTPLAQVQAQVKALQGYGAVVAMVHSEEKDISAKTIVGGGFGVMEWYNIHANFSELIGSDILSFDLKNLGKLGTLVQKLITLSPFLSTGAGTPHPDLIYLAFLDVVPKAGFTKWREALKTRLVTGILGSDIHQNVAIDASVCAGALKPLCLGALGLVETAIGIKIPAVVKNLLSSGGSIMLSDGDRVDSYGRLSRWLENRLLVTNKADQLLLQEALAKGRVYGLFSVFGEPVGFSFSGKAGGVALSLGDKAKGPVTLTATLPTLPKSLGGAPIAAADASKATVRLELLQTDSVGTVAVKHAAGLGQSLTLTTSIKGAYHVEMWVKPGHLETALGTSKALAQKEYLWAITNPIIIE